MMEFLVCLSSNELFLITQADKSVLTFISDHRQFLGQSGTLFLYQGNGIDNAGKYEGRIPGDEFIGKQHINQRVLCTCLIAPSPPWWPTVFSC